MLFLAIEDDLNAKQIVNAIAAYMNPVCSTQNVFLPRSSDKLLTMIHHGPTPGMIT